MRYVLPILLSLSGVLSAASSVHALPDPVEWWTSKSDEYIWDWIPDVEVRGIAHRPWGCPICGKKIFENRGHYPWIWHPDRPYKVECPICRQRFPTNDYQKWMLGGRKEKLNTRQQYVDDGEGYVGPDGVRYPFVRYAIGMAYKECVWRWALGTSWGSTGVSRLARAYARTGDEKYAHKCVVILARVATEYPKLNPDRPDNLTLKEVRKIEYRRPRVRMAGTIGGDQRECYYLRNVVGAYRKIYPYISKGCDPDLRRFLAAKGVADVDRLIKWDLIHEMFLGALEGKFASGLGLQGLYRVLIPSAQDWDMHDPSKGVTTEYVIEWILRDGPRPLEHMLCNDFDRDGLNHLPGLGYQFGEGLRQVVPLAELLKSAGVDLYAQPRVREIIRAPVKTAVAGRWYPSTGDGGKWSGYRADSQWQSKWLGPLLAATGDPLLAQALANSPEGVGSYADQVEEVTARFGREIALPSRNYPIFGMAILESGKGDFRRGLTCYYGGALGHCHFDRLTLSVFNRRGPVTPDLGYPHMSAPDRWRWTGNTAAHNTVVVDACKQENLEPGHLTMFAVTPTVKGVTVDGKIAYRGVVSKYNRTLVWVDIDGKNSYLVDVFRVAGGSQHDYSLHGAGREVTVTGVELARQERGTLAGPDVAFAEQYDDDGPVTGEGYRYRGSGYQYLVNVERGPAKEGLVATWNHWKEKTPSLRVHVPRGAAEQVLFADGLPPFGKPEEALRYMFLRNGSCPPHNRQYSDKKRVAPIGKRQSTFVTVLEPLLDETFIDRVERISDVKGTNDTDVALAIKRTDGATDLLICLGVASEVTARDMAFAGRIGLCTMGDDGKASRLALLDGRSMSCRGSSIGNVAPSEGIVRTVDYGAMTVTVSEKLPEEGALAGRTIVFSIPPRTTSFVIESVRTVDGGSRVKLRGIDASVYRSEVAAVDDEAATVTLSSPVGILHRGSGLAGMRLWNENGSLGLRIKRFCPGEGNPNPRSPFGGTAYVERGHSLEAAFRDLNGDGRTLAGVCEFGPGDQYRIASTAYLGQEHQ